MAVPFRGAWRVDQQGDTALAPPQSEQGSKLTRASRSRVFEVSAELKVLPRGLGGSQSQSYADEVWVVRFELLKDAGLVVGDWIPNPGSVLAEPRWGALMGRLKCLLNSLARPLRDLHVDVLLIRYETDFQEEKNEKAKKEHFHRDLGMVLWPWQELHIIKTHGTPSGYSYSCGYSYVTH